MGAPAGKWPVRLGRALAIAGVALLTTGADAPSMACDCDQRPDWRERPKPEDILAVFPPGALQRGRKGQATIQCMVTTLGRLRDCLVVSETPPGEGFGAAAIALTPQMQMNPGMKQGQPVEAPVRIPISFDPKGAHGPILSHTVVSNVPWLEGPTVRQVVAAYPQKAREQRLAGFAMLDCVFDEQARLKNCWVAQEKPRGLGFGKAARELASQFRGPDLPPGSRPLKGMHTHVPFTFAVEMLDQSEPLVGKPRWASLPSSEEAEAGFPSAATQAGVSTGRVHLSCRVAAGGGVEDCAVVSEEPAGLGFGEAGLALSKAFRMTAWTVEGLPTVGGRVRIPLRYEQKASAAPPAP